MLSHEVLSIFSPLLPIGSFTYSQGLESAVEDGLVSDEISLQNWVGDSIENGIVYFELPLLKRLLFAAEKNNIDEFINWCEFAIASRTTMELRMEEEQKGKAFLSIMPSLGINVEKIPQELKICISRTYLGAIAYSATILKISLNAFLEVFIFSCVESLAMAGAKIIPLGQSAVWRIITHATRNTIDYINIANNVNDEDIGSGLMNQAIESCCHEVMYSRIYRN